LKGSLKRFLKLGLKIMKSLKVKVNEVPQCPVCQGKLRHKKHALFECRNPECPVIEVHVYESEIDRIKRSALWR